MMGKIVTNDRPGLRLLLGSLAFVLADCGSAKGSAASDERGSSVNVTQDVQVDVGEDTDRVSITTIDFPGALHTEANGINSDGDVVGRYISVDGKNHGYRFSEGEFASFDFPGAVWTGAIGINDDGEVVGRYQNAGDGPTQYHGFSLTDGSFRSIDFSATFTTTNGINSRGDIVGGYEDATKVRHGFLLSDGQLTSFDVPGATLTVAFGITSDGTIAGRQVSAGKFHAFVLTHGVFTTVDFPDAVQTAPTEAPIVGVNDRGDVVSTYCARQPCAQHPGIALDNMHGFLLSGHDGSYTTIDVPGAVGTAASGINSRGDVVGRYVDASVKSHGFLRRRNREEDR